MQPALTARRAKSGSSLWACSARKAQAKVDPNTISYIAANVDCEKGQEWQQALGLLSGEMANARVEADAIGYNAAGVNCEKGQGWQLALRLLSKMANDRAKADVISYNAAMSACRWVFPYCPP